MINSRQEYHGNPAGTAIAMGYFDGVHLGHKEVILAAKKYAEKAGLKLAVFTYTLSEEGVKGKLLMSHSQKYKMLEDLGVQFCFEPPFETFCELEPKVFFEDMLLKEYGAKALFCGTDFAFGKHRGGTVEVLQNLCSENKIHLSILALSGWQGNSVSSSRIRAALSSGDIGAVNAMLGREYSISFPVKHGEKLGRTLGFPTLNQVYPTQMQAPKQGVYISRTFLEGKFWPSVTGYGTRPTLGGVEPTCETFVPNFSGQVYGEEITVKFYKYLAATQQFSSKDVLAIAVKAWAEEALAFFA